jgi:hypothetical protein
MVLAEVVRVRRTPAGNCRTASIATSAIWGCSAWGSSQRDRGDRLVAHDDLAEYAAGLDALLCPAHLRGVDGCHNLHLRHCVGTDLHRFASSGCSDTV